MPTKAKQGELTVIVPQCIAKECKKERRTKYYCHGHYERLKKHGSLLLNVPLQIRSDYPSKYPYEYKIYRNIKARLFNPNNKAYKNYGGRGLKIDDSWRYNFKQFIDDIGPRPSKELTLDRIDNSLGYVKGNMRWTTRQVQAQNQRKKKNTQTGYRGISTQRNKFVVRIGVNYKRLYIGRFETLEEAIEERKKAEKLYFPLLV